MKFHQIATVALVAAASPLSCQAFTVINAPSTTTTKTSTATALNMSVNNNNTSNRRDAIAKLFTTTTATTTAATILLTNPTPATARREPLPEYLTEPTDEFKESERQRDEFRRQQLIVKRKFNTILDRLTFESNTEEELVSDLKELRALVTQTEGLPLGIKKEEMIKIIRAKKAKGFWPTNVEIAYQRLTSEIAYQQSPNRDKDLANPL